MISFMKKCAIVGAVVVAASSASAVTVPAGSQLGVQFTGAYATADGLAIRAGSVINILPITFGLLSFDPVVTSLEIDGPVDLQGLSVGDSTSGFVGDSFTADLEMPSVSFSVLTGGVDVAFLATSTEDTVDTAIPSTFGDSLLLEGFGLLDGALASWGLSIAGSASSGTFTFNVNVPPVIEVAPIPLPAGAPLLIGALGALAFARRKAA